MERFFPDQASYTVAELTCVLRCYYPNLTALAVYQWISFKKLAATQPIDGGHIYVAKRELLRMVEQAEAAGIEPEAMEPWPGRRRRTRSGRRFATPKGASGC